MTTRDEKHLQSVMDRLMEGGSFVGDLWGIHEVYKGWPFFQRKVGYRAVGATCTGHVVYGEVRQTPRGALRALAERIIST